MKYLALAAALLLPATAALASGGAVPADTEAQIRTMLTDQGYEVRSVQTEDGMYEAYALKDGQRYEIYLDTALNIVRGADSDD
ncbi:PepSY domain-containing protein [Rhodobacter sp. NTK016B]|uniref:PepSY domain-containing protein n=1 Tax=Rhodobacter sp. NTK016B TaxID=2759676 RepID=UPI001A8D9560|nr:PepSY domain-containing protein [Rhodobacter sp. NTK016B]MBN8291387.1 PepSY domain-containing protein [Rhodobacter sp. NTK016B]